jgi:hypothetical protein
VSGGEIGYHGFLRARKLNLDLTHPKLRSPIRFGSSRGIKMVTADESNRFRSKITGNVYEVKKIADRMIVLESLNGTSQVLTESDNIALFYEKESKKDEDQG